MPQPLRRSTMGPMQGGRAPADARSPDYSDGIKPSAMQRLDMRDNTPLGMLLIDQLETFHGRHTHGQAWEIEGWYGGDTNKLWVQTEGSRQQAVYEEASVSALWNHALSSYWNTQLGIRRDFAKDSKRSWLGIGLQGLAPYWFELEPMLYLSPKGQVAARLRGSYDLFLTQRLILQPEVEINVSAKNDPHRRIGSGLTDMQFGLRLRYEIRRQFAPYLGLKWLRRFGATADAARQDHQPVFDRQVIAGIRMWF